MLDNAVALAWNQRRMAPLSDQRRLFSAVLDCFDTGVALLGDGCDMVHVNGALRALEPLGVLRIGAETLHFADRAANEAFEALLARITTSEAEDAAFVARDPERNHALVVRVIAVRERRNPCDGRCGAIVLATNPNRRTLADRAFFQTAFGLSRAEAGVAVTLLEGLDSKEVAARLHVSHETVRTHLKRIFEKTRTRRQAELVLVLMQTACVGPARAALTQAGEDRARTPI